MKEKVKKCNNIFKKKNEAKFSATEVLLISIVVILLTTIISFAFYKKNFKEYPDQFTDILETYNYIIENYYKDVKSEDLISGAIKGMLEATGDEYTTYLDESDSNTIDVLLEGSYEGLGIQVANSTDYEHIYITGIVKNSPAAKSELQVGDEIISINSKTFKGEKTDVLVDYIKNDNDKNFSVIVLRDEKEYTINITREYIELESVSSDIFEENNKKIGYIYISLFANNTDSQFEKQLNELENKEIDSLIIDVRDNSGGHLTSVSNMISNFVDSSYIIYNIENKGKIIPTYSTGNKTKKYNIVILINNNSASASEVLAGSLKDNLNAYLIGTTSFGKGTVQQLNTLPNGDYYKVTTQKWLTPNKTWINEKGLSPDLEVELSDEYDGTYKTDNQLQAAIEHLIKV